MSIIPGEAMNGMTSELIAPSAYRVWATCMCVETPWDNAQQEAWDRVATMAIRIVDANIVNEVSMSTMSLARQLFIIAYGPDAVERWPLASEQEKRAWNAIGRHVVNCLDAEAGVINLEEMESLIVKWFVKQFEGELV